MQTDVVIVGAGTAGAVCAKRLAQYNIDTVVVDRREKELIGKKVCGNATAYVYFDELKGVVDRPTGDELVWEVDGLDIYGPNMEDKIEIHDPSLSGIMIDRLKFGQRLVNDMINQGAKLHDKSKCADLIYENKKLAGIKIINTETNEIDQIKSKIIIDAGGHAAPVRNKLKSDYIENKIDRKDMGICYREIRKLNNNMSNSKYATLCIDHKRAPKGYIWIFPGGNIVNIGLGVAGGRGYPNPKKLFSGFFGNMDEIKNSELIDAGGGVAPVRRPINSLVDDNFMAIGDSAAQTNPIDAGGIGYSMLAGLYCADAAEDAIEKNNASIDNLWDYNVKYMKKIGAHQAASEVTKILLQKMSDKDLKFTLEKNIFTSEDVKRAVKDAEVKISFFSKLKRFMKGITKISLLKKINKAIKYSQKAMEMYEDYPTSKDSFFDWKDKENQLFSKINEL